MFSRIAILLAVVVTSSSISSLANAEEIKWQTDLDTAIALAKQHHKPLWLHCWFNGCGPCKQLETYVFPKEKFIDAVRESVIPVSVDITVQRELAKRYNVNRVPHDVFITPSGEVLLTRSSPRDVDNYIKLLKQVAKQYEKQTMLTGGGLNLVDPQAELAQFGGEVRQQSLQVASKSSDSMISKTDNFAKRATGSVASLGNQFSKEATDKYDTSNRFVQQQDYTKPTLGAAKTPTKSENSLVAFQQRTNEAAQLANQFGATENESNKKRNTFFPTNNNSASGMTGHDNVVQNPFIKGGNKLAAVQANAANASQPVVAASSELESVLENASEDLKAPALDGFCPVTLQEKRKWEQGNKEWGCYHRGKLFFFANEATRTKFMADPDRYSPALAGYDPVVFAETGKLVNGKRDIGVFYPAKDAKIFVFATAESKAKFQKTPEAFADKVRTATAECDARDNVR